MSRRAVCALVLCAAACRDLVVRGDSRMSGSHRARSVTVSQGARLTAAGDLELISEQDLVVDGTIDSDPEASVTLVSLDGSVRITGLVQGGPGLDGGPRLGFGGPADAGDAGAGGGPDGGNDAGTDGGPTAFGRAGGTGGGVTISAEAGSVVIDGEVYGGEGGRGQDVRVVSTAQVATAVSGAGGVGGSITVRAAREVTGGGGLQAGGGGKGGLAEARGQNAVATAGKGGDGGAVAITLGPQGAFAGLKQGFHGGPGGDVSDAISSAEVTATSTVEAGGTGGSCDVEGPLTIAVSRPEPGNGGGSLGDHRAKATTGGRSGASALVRGGGPAGTGKVRGAALLVGQGGDCGGAEATSASGTDTQPGQRHAGAKPGGPVHAVQ